MVLMPMLAIYLFELCNLSSSIVSSCVPGFRVQASKCLWTDIYFLQHVQLDSSQSSASGGFYLAKRHQCN